MKWSVSVCVCLCEANRGVHREPRRPSQGHDRTQAGRQAALHRATATARRTTDARRTAETRRTQTHSTVGATTSLDYCNAVNVVVHSTHSRVFSFVKTFRFLCCFFIIANGITLIANHSTRSLVQLSLCSFIPAFIYSFIHSLRRNQQ